MAKRIAEDVTMDEVPIKRPKLSSLSSGLPAWRTTTKPLDVDTVYHLIQRGSLKRLKKYLDKYSPEAIQELFCRAEDWTCLHSVFDQRNSETMVYLLEKVAADPDVKNREGLTLLYRAVMLGDDFYVDLFLRHGASVRKADEDLRWRSCGYGPLVHEAVMTENLNILKQVLVAGADRNRGQDISGRSSLHLAAEVGSLDTVTMLYHHGAQLWQVDQRGHTPVYYAARQPPEDTAIADFFLGHWDARMCQALGDFAVVFGGTVDSVLAETVMRDLPVKLRGDCYDFLGIGSVLLGLNDHAIAMWIKAEKLSKLNHIDHSSTDTLARWLSVNEERSREGLRDADLYLQAAIRADRIVPRSFFTVNTLCLILESEFEIMDKAWRNIVIFHRAISHASHCLDRMDAEWTMYDLFLCVDWEALAEKEHINLYGALLPLLDFSVTCLTTDFMARSRTEGRQRHEIIGTRLCKDCEHIRFRTKLLVKLLALLLRHKSEATQEQWENFVGQATQMLRHDPRIQGSTILHLGYGVLRPEVFTPAVIKLLVQISAQNMALSHHPEIPLHLHPDLLGRTPLHCYAELLPVDWLTKEGVLACLMQSGAHLSTPDRFGKTVRDILALREIDTHGMDPFKLMQGRDEEIKVDLD